MSTSSMDMMMGREEGEQRLRVCMMGDSNVGKSSLVSQFLTSDHIKDFDATLGMNFIMNNKLENSLQSAEDYGEKNLSVKIDEEELEMDFIDHPSDEISVS